MKMISILKFMIPLITIFTNMLFPILNNFANPEIFFILACGLIIFCSFIIYEIKSSRINMLAILFTNIISLLNLWVLFKIRKQIIIDQKKDKLLDDNIQVYDL